MGALTQVRPKRRPSLRAGLGHGGQNPRGKQVGKELTEDTI